MILRLNESLQTSFLPKSTHQEHPHNIHKRSLTKSQTFSQASSARQLPLRITISSPSRTTLDMNQYKGTSFRLMDLPQEIRDKVSKLCLDFFPIHTHESKRTVHKNITLTRGYQIYSYLIPTGLKISLETRPSKSSLEPYGVTFIAAPKNRPDIVQLCALHNVNHRIRFELLEILRVTSICLCLDRRLERDEESCLEDAERLEDAATLGDLSQSENLRNITSIVKAYAFVCHVHIIHVHSMSTLR